VSGWSLESNPCLSSIPKENNEDIQKNNESVAAIETWKGSFSGPEM
jgi:hypothetical protein